MPGPTDDDAAPGWDAIDAALGPIYGNRQPLHYGTVIKWMLGGPDPLDGVSVYHHDDPNGSFHWHYVSYGMSELYCKNSNNKEVSGWGLEFTFRLKPTPDEEKPPVWPISFMQNLGRYVFETGNILAPGHRMPVNGPIAAERQTLLHAALFCEDDDLKSIATPNGKLTFVQIVGVTLDEMSAAQAWNSLRVLDLMRPGNPLLITDLDRRSILVDPSIAGLIADGAARDGSASGWLNLDHLHVAAEGDLLILEIGALAVASFQAMLRGRIGHQRPFTVKGPQLSARFVLADRFSWQPAADDEPLTIHLPVSAGISLAKRVQICRGEYRIPELSKILIRVIPTEIKDAHGEKVTDIIG